MNESESLIDSKRDDVYWAAAPVDELAETVLCAVNAYYGELVNRGLWRLWRQVFRAYYGMSEGGEDHESSMVSFLGADGETVFVRVNHLRRLVRRVVTMATSNPPGMNPRPTNTDFDSLKQVPVARNVIDHVFREKRVNATASSALEAAMLFGVAYTGADWDPNAGKMVGKIPVVFEEDEIGEDGQPVIGEDGQPRLAGMPTGEERAEYEGDINIGYLTPVDVIVPPGVNGHAMPWVIRRQFVNRWDLAALYPDKRDEIVNIERRAEDMGFSFASDLQNHDEIPVYHFYAASSPSLEGGRYALIASRDCVLTDGPLPYDDIPIYRVSPGDIIGTSIGYADSWDLLAIQSACDAALSSLLSINDAFGVPNIAVESGTDVSTASLTGGFNRWDYPAGGQPPQVISLQEFPQGTFSLIETLRADMEALVNLNSSALGDPTSNVKSGAMAAILKSEAVEANSGLQGSFHRMLEDLATAVIRILKRYADTPRLIAIAGKDNEDGIASFVGQDISNIDRVTVNIGTSMLRTTEGRWTVFEMGYNKGEINLGDGIEMLETGALPDKYQRTNGQRSLIKKENEILTAGPRTLMQPGQNPPPEGAVEGVRMMMTDDHAAHIVGHSRTLDSPQARENPAVVAAVNAHILEHLMALETMDPRLAAVLGIQMLPPPDQVEPPPEQAQGGRQQQRPSPQGPGPEAPGEGGPPADQAQRAQQAPAPRPAPQGAMQ